MGPRLVSKRTRNCAGAAATGAGAAGGGGVGAGVAVSAGAGVDLSQEARKTIAAVVTMWMRFMGSDG